MADNTQYTPEQLASLQSYAEALLKPGELTYGSGQHPLQALATIFRSAQGKSTLDLVNRARGAQRQQQFAPTPTSSGIETGSINPIVNAVNPNPPPPQPQPATFGSTDITGPQGTRLTQVRAPRSGANFTVSAEHSSRFQGLLDDLEAAGINIDPRTSGGFNPRNIRGTSTPSQHSFGRAIDINPNLNSVGSQGQFDPTIVRAIAAKHGFTWGGDWRGSSRDPMHFEINDRAGVQPARRFPTTLPPAGGATPPMRLGAGDLAAPQLAEAATENSLVERVQAPGAGQSNLPVGVPQQIAPDPNIQRLERQLGMAATLSQEDAMKLNQQYMSLVAPQAREVPSGTAYYDGRTGKFLYLLPKITRRPVSAGGASTEQLLIPQEGGFSEVPISEQGGAARSGERTTYGIPRNPSGSGIGDVAQFGLETEAARRLVEAQTGNVTAAVNAGPIAARQINLFNTMLASSRRGGFIRGQPTADFVQQARTLISNFNDVLPAYMRVNTEGMSNADIVNKLHGQLSALASQAMSSRGTNLDLNTASSTIPGLNNSQASTEMLLDILKQEAQSQVRLSRAAQRLRPNQVQEWADIITREYENHAIELRLPDGRRVTTRPINSPEDADKLPQGTWFIDPTGTIRQRP